MQHLFAVMRLVTGLRLNPCPPFSERFSSPLNSVWLCQCIFLRAKFLLPPVIFNWLLSHFIVGRNNASLFVLLLFSFLFSLYVQHMPIAIDQVT